MKYQLKVAIVQTTIDHAIAWNSLSPNAPEMSDTEGMRAWNEIMVSLSNYKNMSLSTRPEVIVLPELTLAKEYERRLVDMAAQIGAIIIAGCDYKKITDCEVINRGVLIAPRYWPFGKGDSHNVKVYFGKKNPASNERQLIEGIPSTTSDSKHCAFHPCNEVFIVDLGEYGKVGLSICADFYDIERYAYYKGRIQHLFIIAYNQDVKSFYFLAEAISRLVFCNVVICNSGHYGGSIAFSLFNKDFKRYIYKHEGSKLFTSQVIGLPVEELYKAQQGDPKAAKLFKSVPPGYEYKYSNGQ